MFRIVTVSSMSLSTKAVLMSVSLDRENVIRVPLQSEIRVLATNGRVVNLIVTGVCKIASSEARLVDCDGKLPSNDFVGTLNKSDNSDKLFVFQVLDSKRPRDEDEGGDHDGQLGQRPRNNTA